MRQWVNHLVGANSDVFVNIKLVDNDVAGEK